MANTPMNDMTMNLWMMPGKQKKEHHLAFMQSFFKSGVIGSGACCSLASLHGTQGDFVGDARQPRLAGTHGDHVVQMLLGGGQDTRMVSSWQNS
jgi:hypothetical protein